jgi:hypothetical protein
MPTALAPRAIAMTSRRRTAAQKVVWMTFIKRNVFGFRASRAKRTMERMSMSRQAIMRSMNTAMTLGNMSVKCLQLKKRIWDSTYPIAGALLSGSSVKTFRAIA